MSESHTSTGAFFEYLIRTGAAPREKIERALKAGGRPLLGQVFLSLGYLTVRQVSELLGMQADQPYLRLGELAVRQSMIEPIQLAIALEAQNDTRRHPLFRLAAMERHDAVWLVEAMMAYIAEQEREPAPKSANDDGSPAKADPSQAA